MLPQRFDFPDLYQGDTYEAIHFTFAASVGGEPAEAIDLLGCSVLIQLRKNDRLCWQFATTTPTAQGTFSIVADELVGVAPGVYDVDVQITLASGAVKTYLRGECVVVDDVSRA
jgi:hypothetical protein